MAEEIRPLTIKKKFPVQQAAPAPTTTQTTQTTVANAPRIADLQRFISVMNSEKGPARQNRYCVRFTPPPMARFGQDSLDTSFMTNELVFYCEEAMIPDRTVITTQSVMGGLNVKYPYMTEYQEVTFTFLVMNMFRVKNLFDTWQNIIVPPGSYDLNYRDEYSATIEIFQFDETDAAIYYKNLIKAHPIRVAAMGLAWQAQNMYHKLEVTFNYERWVRNGNDTKRSLAVTTPLTV